MWERLGDVDNYAEPFAGSLACLLKRPHPRGIETVNDLDGLLTNFWRAVRADPDQTAEYADWPVSELDLHARHRWLVGQRERITDQLRADPEWFDAKAAGWWCWGLCCWIGGGWCQKPEGRYDFMRGRGGNATATHQTSEQIPILSQGGNGVTVSTIGDGRRPRIGGRTPEEYGCGVNAKGDKLPRLNCGQPGSGALGTGVASNGPNRRNSPRPQLADAFDIGRGVNSSGQLGTCDSRRQWLQGWFRDLTDRLRLVRICAGHWARICDSESVLTRLGTTGVFLDPPYSAEAGRDMKLYAKESGTVAHEVREWCLKWGHKHDIRIVLAGYQGEHEELERSGWTVQSWETGGGYANQSGSKGENAKRERLWFSPHCLSQPGLFDGM